MFEFRVLGVPSISADPAIRLPQNYEFLLLFLAGSGRPVSRVAVADLIWPSASSGSGRHSLSQALYVLRKLGLDVVASDGDHLRLRSNVSVDVDHFHSAIQRKDFQEAATYYRGPFAAGIAPTQDAFSEWVDVARQRLHHAAREVCLQLRDNLDLERAVALSEQLLDTDPLDEDLWQLRLEVLSASGQTNRVADLYAHLQRFWPDQVDRPWPNPKPALPESGPGPNLLTRQRATGGVFVGRRAELDDLISLWRAEPSGFEYVIISGEAGVGKTALADRLRRLLVLRGASTVWASAHPLESSVPLGIAAQWLEELLPAPTEILDKLRTVGFPSVSAPLAGPLESPLFGRELLFSSINRELTRAGKPLCIFLDDVQWADDASLGLLGYIRRYRRSQRIMVVMTVRPDDGKELSGLLRSATTLELSPLRIEDIVELCRRRSDLKGEGALAAAGEALYERTGGNPLLLTALLLDNTAWPPDEHTVPTTIVKFLMGRLERLSSPARIVMAGLGVLRSGTMETLQAVTQLGSDLGESLAELRKASFVVYDGPRVRPRHGMMADVAIDIVGPALERQMRGRAAKLLRPGSAPLAAIQFDLAGHRERAHEVSLQAATASLELFAFQEALYFFRIAFANAGSDEAKAKICCRLSDLHLSQRNYPAATEALKTADSLRLSTETQKNIQAHSAIVRLHGVQDSTALDDADRIFRTSATALSRELAARLAMAACFAAHSQGKPREVRQWARLISDVAEELPPGKVRIRVLLAVGAMKALYESATETAKEIELLVKDSAIWPDLLATAFATLGSARVAAGQSREAEAAFLAALEIVETTGSQEPLFMIANNLGALYQEEGRFDEAVAMYDRAVDAQTEDAVPAWAQLTLDNLTTLAYERGEWDVAVSRAEDLLGRFDRGRISTRSWFSQHSIRGLSCLRLGRRTAAQDSRAAIEDAYLALGYSSNDISYVEVFLARMAELEGRSKEAIARLNARAADYLDRDFFCAARMEVEKLRLLLSESPSSVLQSGFALRVKLMNARARPLVDRLDGILTRASAASP